MAGISPKFRKLIRPIAGLFFLTLGLIFMFVPFIPLGYIFIIIALFLLSYELPFIRRFIDKIRKKDNGNNVEKIEEHIEEAEKKVEDSIIDQEKRGYEQ